MKSFALSLIVIASTCSAGSYTCEIGSQGVFKSHSIPMNKVTDISVDDHVVTFFLHQNNSSLMLAEKSASLDKKLLNMKVPAGEFHVSLPAAAKTFNVNCLNEGTVSPNRTTASQKKI